MKSFNIFFISSLLFIFLSSCSDKNDEYIDPRGSDYAGSESCIQCHKKEYESALSTSHYNATAVATLGNVLGDFSKGNYIFTYDKNTKLVMEKRNDSLYQVLYKNGKEVESHKFEIVFGSKHAQTSVYWRDNNTYELPLSFYASANSWATSPGFTSDKADFSRKVAKDCYSCHSSNASSRTVTKNSQEHNFLSMDLEDVINEKTIVYGIDCERCHGPAKKHTEFHLKNPTVKEANSIAKYKYLNKQQRLDACAICHSGNHDAKMKSRFEFKPGDNFSDYYRSLRDLNDTASFDVHGNQYRLMAQSKCFIKSDKMDCMTCHNPHKNASPDLTSYSKICMSCHQVTKHSEPTLKEISRSLLANNCVECHMPKKPSNAIRFQLSKGAEMSDYNLRTHKIAIYPSTKK